MTLSNRTGRLAWIAGASSLCCMTGLLALAEDDTRSMTTDAVIATAIRLEVDTTDLFRNLTRSSMMIDVEPGPIDLHYVRWSPGNHTPSGPIQNVVDLVIRDCEGQPLDWFRDTEIGTKLTIEVPDGCDQIRVDMTYIASQPSALSGSTDSYGRATFGGLNWNTVLFYPDGLTHQQIEVSASLAIPDHWKHATSLLELETPPKPDRLQRVSGVRWIDFVPVNLAELVDSPVIMGEHLRSYKLDAGAIAPHWMHIVADEPANAELPKWLEAKFEAMIRQTVAVFNQPSQQHFPRDRYHFLLLLGDGIRCGVEHATCTFIGSHARAISGAEETATKGGGGGLGVVPHEYFHTWCAKLAAPRGLIQSNFHTPPSPDLLWVYEGLTTYYTSVLSVRSGLTTFSEYLDGLKRSIIDYEHRQGRLWRSVVDTTRAAQSLRTPTKQWHKKRQGQEYYGQGAMFWLEADALIRVGTRGQRSLDDFCARLFDVEALPVGRQVTFTREDIVDLLTSVYDEVNWDGLVRTRLEQPQRSLKMTELLERIGYRLIYNDEPSTSQATRLRGRKTSDLTTSLGIEVDEDGKVSDIVPDSPAYLAKMAFGMEIVSVDEFVFSHKRLREAVERSPESGAIMLAVRFGERVVPIEIAYNGGARYPLLEHDPVRVDVLTQIAAPKVFSPAR
jgi:predicted metalloprotease with PDZ domain